MSEVSLIRAGPPQGFALPERKAEAPHQSPELQKGEAAPRAPVPETLQAKTVVKAERLSKYIYGYMFIDRETSQVVGRYPAEPFVAQTNAVSKRV